MIKQYIKRYKNFPIKGIDFKCTASLCQYAQGFREANDFLHDSIGSIGIDKVIGIDARGFIFAAVLADRIRKPLILARKTGKLPPPIRSKSYDLEYGTATLEIKSDSIEKFENVVIIDDLIATGGTINAAIDIVNELEANVIAVGCVMDLPFLSGSSKIRERGIPVHSGVEYHD